MNNSDRSRTFRADYIVRGNDYPHVTAPGSKTTPRKWDLEGYDELAAINLVTPEGGRKDKYVAMHLLPERLGGLAFKSNLTPALGSVNNPAFKKTVEEPAEDVSVDGIETKREPIWYDFTIEYYPSGINLPPGKTWIDTSSRAPVAFHSDAYPRLLKAEWNTYEKYATERDQPPRRKPAEKRKTYEVTPPLPTFDRAGTPEEITAIVAVEHVGE